MTQSSENPVWWNLVNGYRTYSYFVVASSVMVVYDWALNFGQDVELFWRQRWSIITFLYFGLRCIGVLYSGAVVLVYISSVSVIHASSAILYITLVASTMLGFIMAIRLHAMYHRSRKMLVFLVITLTAVTIAFGVMVVLGSQNTSTDALIPSSTYECNYGDNLLVTLAWLPYTVWEILTLTLAMWITVKHFRELSEVSKIKWSFRGCYAVLIKSHIFYSIAFVTTSCLNLVSLSSKISNSSDSVGIQVYYGVFQIAIAVQMFVLGPRLIVSIRRYDAKLKANSDSGTSTITTISFPEALPTLSYDDVDV